ncbi:MAG TPA: hypothetical protein VJ596_03045, partial [Gemmatimonadaceae bacterium]|nr:hypothetical protein [Gemmatimonadaceae bacterium]
MKSNSPVLVLLSCLAWSPAFAQADSSASRICMAPASVKALAGSTTSTMEAVRESFTSFLTGPSLRVAPLAARLESQAREEARLAACPYLLFVSVEHKRHSGRNLLGKAASSAVQQGAYRAGSMVRSDAGSIAASAVAGAASAAV